MKRNYPKMICRKCGKPLHDQSAPKEGGNYMKYGFHIACLNTERVRRETLGR